MTLARGGFDRATLAGWPRPFRFGILCPNRLQSVALVRIQMVFIRVVWEGDTQPRKSLLPEQPKKAGSGALLHCDDGVRSRIPQPTLMG